jgi:hypothetical protein
VTRYQAAKTITGDVTDAFAFLADPANLPHYFPRITSAELVGHELVRTTAVINENTPDDGDGEPVTADAWFRANTNSETISWGSPGPKEYSGSLRASAFGNAALLEREINTAAHYPGVQSSLDEALEAIGQRLSGETNASEH